MYDDWVDYGEAYAGGGARVAGTVKVLRDVDAGPLGRSREILVYLPPSYASSNRTYPTLYMHDGQNLFDPDTSFAGEWGVDETLESLAGEGLEAIVVGIPNAGDRRISEYSPFRDPALGGGEADAYLRFVVETVKPLVDESFRTTGERERTATIGSSMGGLVSLYAYFARPETFGLAGVFSPSVGFARGAILPFLAKAPHVPGRIYLDVGAFEGSRREPGAYVRLVREARDRLIANGYREGDDLLYVEDAGGRHDEASWSRRLPRALRFLLSGNASAVAPSEVSRDRLQDDREPPREDLEGR